MSSLMAKSNWNDYRAGIYYRLRNLILEMDILGFQGE